MSKIVLDLILLSVYHIRIHSPDVCFFTRFTWYFFYILQCIVVYLNLFKVQDILILTQSYHINIRYLHGYILAKTEYPHWYIAT
ncbi:hypothetical protein RIF29_18008 [Crotalaria pallida]|uniref:Uncharacterized protein n=1 Tax=Crotalaria pallida TaxID=3830 RepID=A0AAN9IF27_CROPI